MEKEYDGWKVKAVVALEATHLKMIPYSKYAEIIDHAGHGENARTPAYIMQLFEGLIH